MRTTIAGTPGEPLSFAQAKGTCDRIFVGLHLAEDTADASLRGKPDSFGVLGEQNGRIDALPVGRAWLGACLLGAYECSALYKQSLTLFSGRLVLCVFF